MGLKLVIERECSRDHQTALRQFLCCEPGGPEWAMDPQRYIRDLSVRKTPKGIMRTLLVVSGDIPLHDDVVGFCEYGVAVETTDEHSGGFYIRSLFRVAVGVASPVAVFGVADFVGQYAPVLGWGEVVRYVDGLGVRVVESLVPGLHRGDDDSFRVPPGFLL